MATELKVNEGLPTEHVYRIGKMDAFTQLHVGRRLAPLLAALRGAPLPPKADDSGDTTGVTTDQMLSVFGSMAEVLSRMSDTEVNYIINACLAVCLRQQGDQWHPVRHRNGALMFNDFSADELLQVTYAAIEENLGSFFGGPAGGSA